MKIRPIHIYLGAFIIIIISLVLITSEDTSSSSFQGNTNQSQLPQDDIHQNLGNAPGSGNVSSEFKENMARLKAGYENNPSDTLNALEYARLLAAAHQPDEALEVYNKILEFDSGRTDIRLEVATVYYNMQNFTEAKKQMEAVLAKEPDSPDVQYNLGAIEAALGNLVKAKEIWEKVMTEYPTSEAAKIASSSLQNLN
ncbi:MAG: tetratricopeptide repeat protein [Melioribacteraceae bacterium]|jgi:tetratricopeptide (TPR) repeat protein|nr:MAG: tetratricopeptide repeat protein [Melioribacteraceae bacterium]